jgi:sulfatase maturation enzyme AslB (radical SAM superfamily)
MNKYIKLNRIEFIVTNSCTGRCKHCSAGERVRDGKGIDANAAVAAINRLSERFDIDSVMTFGGEPLLFADTTMQIHSTARDCGIPKRQIITNGFFSKNEANIDAVAKGLCDAGINDVLLSVDVFHQENIPLEPVMLFAKSLLRHNVPCLRVQPAWVVNEQNDNAYNAETKRILKKFADIGVSANDGNDIFPAGNALKYLGEYFDTPGKIDLTAPCGSEPYSGRLDDMTCLSFEPNGDVKACSPIIGNIYECDILDIIDAYDPHSIPELNAVLCGGAVELIKYADTKGISVDVSDCRTACNVCRKAMAALQQSKTAS